MPKGSSNSSLPFRTLLPRLATVLIVALLRAWIQTTDFASPASIASAAWIAIPAGVAPPIARSVV